MKFRWSLPEPNLSLVSSVAQAAGVPPLLAQCLVNRGLTASPDIAAFLEPRLKSLLDPFLLPNMDQAVSRLWLARERSENITIFGDYDVDGITASALLMEVLGSLGWSVNCYLPHRFDEGYGLSIEALETCLKTYPTQLLVAVDCGSSALEPLAWLRQRGLDVLILDHHQLSSPNPSVAALVNPRVNLDDAGHPRRPGPDFLELCSVGLAFKLAHALLKRGRECGLAGAAEFDLKTVLDLVALGTIADLVPLCGENRVLVTAGLASLGRRKRLGIERLMEVAKCHEIPDVYQVGYQLAPRLNAAGRLETARAAFDLLLTGDAAVAAKLAGKLDEQNRERQRIERTISQEALVLAQRRFNSDTDFVIVEGAVTLACGSGGNSCFSDPPPFLSAHHCSGRRGGPACAVRAAAFRGLTSQLL